MNQLPETSSGGASDRPARAAASAGDGSHPRPQLTRAHWQDLSGPWDFAYDDADVGLGAGYYAGTSRLRRDPFDRKIRVPFPPESVASSVGDTQFHPVVWYRRVLTRAELVAAGRGIQGERILLHFGAVDYRAQVWLAGVFLGEHQGGHTPFSFDITDVLDPGAGEWTLVVRAADDPLDVAQPRGKQDWRPEPHGIWYHRTTGIWQPVWLEAVPALRVEQLGWNCDLVTGTVRLELELNRRPVVAQQVRVTLSYGPDVLAELSFRQAEPRSTTVISLPRQSNGQDYESLLWSPEHPRLVDAEVVLLDGEFADDESRRPATDCVASYLGLRSVRCADRHFLLNDRPYYVRAVLEQGYWPDTHLAAPDATALRAQVQLAKDLGFNTVRLHEKVEDPRYLYWADRLGLMVWGESPSGYEFSTTAVRWMTQEWLEVLRRDGSHPCIVTWVPLNESWGVQHISHDPAQLHYAQMLYHLTKSIDPSRPVISNDGWEHAISDIWTVHDYGTSGADLAPIYADRGTVDQLLAGVGPLGRRIQLLPMPADDRPLMVSEFGGISYAPAHPATAWGYLVAQDAAEFERLLRDQFTALQSSPVLAGFCYTQMTDTLQEANGLVDPQRRPKLPIDTIRAIVLGESVDTSGHGRPKRPIEQPTGTTNGHHNNLLSPHRPL